MRHHRTTFVIVFAFLVLTAFFPVCDAAGRDGEPFERAVVLRESINLSWTGEWIKIPFEAPRDMCHPESVLMEGPDGPVPAQLIDVETWPDSPYVRTATLIYVTDLNPLEEREFNLRYGPEPISGGTSDLSIKESGDQVEMINDNFGIRLFLGEHSYDPAETAENVPGPVHGVRLADGTWTGSSRLYGPGKITSVRSRLVENGPALARLEMVYSYEDGRTMTLTAQLASRAPRAEWDMFVEPYDPEKAALFVLGSGWDAAEAEAADTAARDGWEWLLDGGFDDIALAVQMNQVPARNRWGEPEMGPRGRGGRYNYLGLDLTPYVVDLAAEPAGELALWMPWAAFHQTRQSVMSFTRTGDREARSEELQFAVLDPGRWVEPAEPGTWASYMNVRTRHKSVPLKRGEDGAIFLQFSTASGYRRWQVGIPEPLEPEDRWHQGYLLHGRARRIGTKNATWALNKIENLVLEWEDDSPLEPLGPEQVDEIDPQALASHLQGGRGWRFSGLSGSDRHALDAYRLSGRDPGVAQKLRLVERLGYFLSLGPNMDRWRYGTREILPELYDEVMRSDLVDARQRRLFRAQMAHLGYIMDDPGDWSPERGWASGNLNMTIYNIKTSAHIASRLPGHPQAPNWSEPAALWADRFLEDYIGPKGEFIRSGESPTHYVWGSAGAILSNAVLAREAGGPDMVTDPRMKRMVSFLAQIVTPPDPRAHRFHPVPRSVTPPVGRGTVYNVPGLYDRMAREIADTDPELAGDLWWAWQRANPGERAGKPYRTPEWTSVLFPKTGVILRHGLDTMREHYAFFVLENSGVAYASESGAFAAIWAHGVPIATRFGGSGYAEREEILISRVLPAWNPGDREQRFSRFLHDGPRSISATSFLPRQDYIRAELRLEQNKPIHHGGVENIPRWPEMETEAELPVGWRRQVLFVKGRDAGAASYYVFRDTVSGGQPTRWQFWTISDKIGTPEEVKDLHAFLSDKPGDSMQDAREIDGDRFTAIGQLGVDMEYYIASPKDTPRHTLRWGLEHAHYSEYHDLLHLQQKDDGAYFVALFPRLRDASAPEFSTLADGNVIEVEGDFGRDLVFLADEDIEVETNGIVFSGTAASVQNRRDGGQVISLGAAGMVRLQDGTMLASDAAVSLHAGDVMTVIVPEAPAGERTVRLAAPGELSLINPAPGTKLESVDGAAHLTLPAHVRTVLLLAGE